MSAERLVVANLWAKQLLVSDVIVDVQPVDTRFGELRLYTVERSPEVHAAEAARLAREITP